ncbi:hypothetical protein [Pelagibacterium sp. H642]|uniref:hypothetical protein n=1 Tax=Pelagibacterium sp. H642 TaxID=1881069 RepID=UPI002815EE9C|nr:hypothetical protein [Pelagibacterium sp. H642]WMT91179.1 hypothetical protein NO934_02660 [Pelagibacterium sp. H642]
MTEAAEPDWARIRAEYEAGEVPIDDLVATHAIKRNQLNYHRRKENWTLRNPVTGKRGLLKRMLSLIERQIARMEHKMNEEPMSATEMRMLESMTKAIDRIGAMEVAEKKARSGRVRMDPELEAIRERLVQRIQELDVEQ